VCSSDLVIVIVSRARRGIARQHPSNTANTGDEIRRLALDPRDSLDSLFTAYLPS
jgi:hypothetical protein